MVSGWDVAPGEVPSPPPNGHVVSPYLPGMQDVHWDDPSIIARNSIFNIVGVNVYRSDASDRGPYFRINEFPLGGNFYRDATNNAFIRETVSWSSWIEKGDAPNSRRWTFRTRHPIVKKIDMAPFQSPTWANAPGDVTVTVDGARAEVHAVFGQARSVTLVNQSEFDVATETYKGATLPTEGSVVEVTYYTNRNHVQSGLDKYLWYRLTTVVVDDTTPSGYRETPLGWCEPMTVGQVEELDYIWREAMRRNHWIRQQGGERVKIFIRKTAGIVCGCNLDPKLREYTGQPSNRCQNCLGTGFVGGYEGPYEDIIAPDDAERRITQSERGRNKEHTYEVWIGPSPLVTQRDFIVKQTNERYSIGSVRRPSNRGNLLQQHFNISYLDEGDIRYAVPIDGTTDLPRHEARDSYTIVEPRPVDGGLDRPAVNLNTGVEPWPVGPDAQTPMETGKSNIPDEREKRGRTRVWENQNY